MTFINNISGTDDADSFEGFKLLYGYPGYLYRMEYLVVSFCAHLVS